MSVTIWLYVIWTAWLLVALVLLANTARASMIIFFLAVTLFLLFETGLDWRAYLIIWLLAHAVTSGFRGFLAEKKDLVFGAISFGGAGWLWLQGGAVGRYYIMIVLGSVGAAAVLIVIGFLTCFMARVRPLRNEVASLSVKLADVRKDLTELRAESAREMSSHRSLANDLRSEIENLQSQLSAAVKSSDSCREKIRRYEAALALSPGPIQDGSSTGDTCTSQSETVTAVRVTVYWEPQDDKPAESGRAVEGARSMATGRDRPGRIVVAREARELRRSEIKDLERVSAAYRGHLLRGGRRERLEEATSAVVAERLADPAYQRISRAFPASRVATPAAIARDLEEADNWMRDIVARPLEQAGRAISVPDPANIGAAIGADYLTSQLTRPLDRAAAIIEVSSFVIGLATGSAPLMISSAKLLAHREITREIQREIIQEVRSLGESRKNPRGRGEGQDRDHAGRGRSEPRAPGGRQTWRSSSGRTGRPDRDNYPRPDRDDYPGRGRDDYPGRGR